MISKYLTIGASIVALSAGMAAAQDAMTDYDTDSDAMVSADEFATGASTRFETDFPNWDADASGSISEDEFGAGTFMRADRNQDSMIDEEEYGLSGMSSEMTDLDTDGDSMLSQDEYSAGMSVDAEGPGTFADYDADASGDISSEEYGQGEFRRYDANQDSMLDETEFGTYSEDSARMSTDG
jgi:hypothetical protein